MPAADTTLTPSDSIARGENVIIDGTLANAEKVSRLADRLQQGRYIIQIASVDGPHDVIALRIAHRWRADYLAAEHGTAEGTAAQLGGRWVPSEVPNELYDNGPDESRCATVARQLARQHPAIADHYSYRVETADTAPQVITPHRPRPCRRCAAQRRTARHHPAQPSHSRYPVSEPVRVPALRRNSREIVDGARPTRRAISRTPSF